MKAITELSEKDFSVRLVLSTSEFLVVCSFLFSLVSVGVYWSISRTVKSPALRTKAVFASSTTAAIMERIVPHSVSCH
jgi:hypothetical protein